MKRKQAIIDQSACVACGCCATVCPKTAITIHKGIFAKVDPSRCIGCGKCMRECPASIIKMEVTDDEKTLV